MSAVSVSARCSRAARLCSPSRIVAFRPPIARSAISVAVINSEMVARKRLFVGLEQAKLPIEPTQYRIVSSSSTETMASTRNP